MIDSLMAAIKARLAETPRDVRERAMRYAHMPIRILRRCLVCGEDGEDGATGLFVPQHDALPNFAIYRFCKIHAGDPSRADPEVVEALILAANADRPHFLSAHLLGPVIFDGERPRPKEEER